MSSEFFTLPVVDFAAFEEETGPDGVFSEAQSRVAQNLDDACRKHGFVCIRNSGISKESIDYMFQVSETLFSCSDETKASFKALDPTSNIGYLGFEKESLNRKRKADLKEVFNVRNPLQEEYPGFVGTSEEFQKVATDFWQQMTKLSQTFAACCAIALGLEPDYFAKTLRDMDLCTLRLNHFPPIHSDKNGESDNDPKSLTSAIRVGEHTDFGLFTFLFIHNIHDVSSHGLQVKAIEGADLGCGSLVTRSSEVFRSGWKDVVFDESFLQQVQEDASGVMLVNTGALMARWTNDTWKATAHRVVVKPEAQHSHRYSIAAFFDPDKSTVCSVHPKFVPAGEVPKYPPISSLDYLLMKLREAQEGTEDSKEEKEP